MSGSHQRKLDLEFSSAFSVTLVGMILDAALGLTKCIGGLLFNSQALLIDGVHSFSDVASDLVVLTVMKLSRRGPDSNHPYGHQRFETMGTMILGSFLIAVGGALAWDNASRIIQGGELQVPGWPVLVIALASVAGKEWIFHYTRRVGQRIRSNLITANAWHSRTDAMSSVVVLIGAAGAMMGYPWLDTVAAIVIAVIIALVGWRYTWSSVQELVDTGLSEEDSRLLLKVARDTEGVQSVHDLRSRKMGSDVLVDVHLQVKPDISVSEGHQVGMQVVERMHEALPDIRDINFHIDAENDERRTPTGQRLPSREGIRQILGERMEELTRQNYRIRPHYLGNHVHLELFFDHSSQAPDQISVEEQLGDLPWLGSVKVWIPSGASTP